MAGVLSRIIRPWRRSLQLRVVTSTVVLGMLAISILGAYLFQQLADGLTDDRVRTARAEAQVLAARAQSTFDSTSAGADTAEFNNVAVGAVVALAPPPTDTTRYVVFTRALDNTAAIRLDTVLTGGLRTSPVPTALKEAVRADPDRQQVTIIQLQRSTLVTEPSSASWTRPDLPAVVIGSQVQASTAGPYDLYFIYPLDREQATLDLVQRLFVIGGLLLVSLLGALSWLVTRQVVSPVRRAAGVAERLAAGHLNERMSARGADDLALLGKSFNDMADHLQSQIRQLEDLSRVQQVFVSDVSHELRTPLTTIRMAADLMYDQRADLAPSLGRSVELLHDQLDRFEALLADLLEISRYDAGAMSLEVDQVDLAALATRVVSGVESLAQRRGSEVTVEAPAEGVTAEADARRVERIVRNLVVNAIEHGEGRPVVVSVAANESAAAIAVRDQGVGLRPGESALVFNRFWRADPARARTTGGTGLGLAISLEDARLHDGWLQAWGEPGKGSVFRLTLPRSAGMPIAESPLPLAPRPPADADATTRLRPVRLVEQP
ncbi:MAG: HAMP domain-containing histidine kinase [Actinobacteria bacterium]|nr:HAMP domain-containing histidine kinase [Actinomycetota bacterium]